MSVRRTSDRAMGPLGTTSFSSELGPSTRT
jgi:hypothetical protein